MNENQPERSPKTPPPGDRSSKGESGSGGSHLLEQNDELFVASEGVQQ